MKSKMKYIFLCVCPIYEHLRFLLFSEVVESVLTVTAEHKFIVLETKYPKNVCKFVISAWEVMKSYLLPTDINLTTV